MNFDRTNHLFADHLDSSKTFVIPVGSVEYHGQHLPVTTDTIITNALVNELGRQRPDSVVIGPTIPYSVSRGSRNAPGTFSIAEEILAQTLRSLASCLPPSMTAIAVSAHGDNLGALIDAGIPFWVPRIHILVDAATRWELPETAVGMWTPDSHAGRTETSMLLAIAPEAVAATPEPPSQAVTAEQATIRSSDSIAIDPGAEHGSYPGGANQEEGLAIMAAFSDDLIACFDDLFRSR